MRSLPAVRNAHRFFAPLAAAMLLLSVVLAAPAATAQSVPQTVQLVVDYGDGVTKTINDLAWANGNTVFDVMTAAASRSHGTSFTYTGSGETAVLTKIDDVQNEGGGTGKRNWQYWVNSAYGDRSFATFELHPGDVVLWRFATQPGQ